MNLDLINIKDCNTWPTAVTGYLESKSDVLKKWSKGNIHYQEAPFLANQYDALIHDLKNVLAPYYLHGYHCSRLTEKEINTIINQGMCLPNSEILRIRLLNLVVDSIVPAAIADQLLMKNESDHQFRKDRIWFIFFPPYIAGESGIERFFRSWGGEALYNDHEEDPVTGPWLTKIGIPCVIEAKVPLNGFYGHSLEINFTKEYVSFRGWSHETRFNYEADLRINLPACNILNIIKFPEPKFIELTHSNLWRQTLQP